LSSLLLASSSPRRRELLSAAGFEFEIVAPRVSEKTDFYLSGGELTTLNAKQKAMAVARHHPDKVVLGVDTLVALEGTVIGKPLDREDAARILRQLSGKTHEVYSSVFIVRLAAGKVRVFSEISRVCFRTLSDSKISDYLGKIDPLDKAGAYAAQGHGAEVIVRIEGSYSNVVGLPMEQTIAALEDFEVRANRK
jgi:nucleoside triphosphate pyrophosphatase